MSIFQRASRQQKIMAPKNKIMSADRLATDVPAKMCHPDKQYSRPPRWRYDIAADCWPLKRLRRWNSGLRKQPRWHRTPRQKRTPFREGEQVRKRPNQKDSNAPSLTSSIRPIRCVARYRATLAPAAKNRAAIKRTGG